MQRVLMNSYRTKWGSVPMETPGKLHEDSSLFHGCYVVNIALNTDKSGNKIPIHGKYCLEYR